MYKSDSIPVGGLNRQDSNLWNYLFLYCMHVSKHITIDSGHAHCPISFL